MLVLSRREGERIFIGDSIVITVVTSDRGKVRVGIQAPKDLEIMREEVYRKNYGHAATDERFGPLPTQSG